MNILLILLDQTFFPEPASFHHNTEKVIYVINHIVLPMVLAITVIPLVLMLVSSFFKKSLLSQETKSIIIQKGVASIVLLTIVIAYIAVMSLGHSLSVNLVLTITVIIDCMACLLFLMNRESKDLK